MTERKKTIRTNVIMVIITILAVVMFSGTGKAAEKFNSQGKIIFTNRTDDTSDDVIFDASDFNKLAIICR